MESNRELDKQGRWAISRIVLETATHHRQVLERHTIDTFRRRLDDWLNHLQIKNQTWNEGRTEMHSLGPLAWIDVNVIETPGLVAYMLTAVNHSPDLIGAIAIEQVDSSSIRVSVNAAPWSRDMWLPDIIDWLESLVGGPKREASGRLEIERPVDPLQTLVDRLKDVNSRSPEWKRQVREWYLCGGKNFTTQAEMAEAFGVSDSKISRAIRDARK